MELEEMKNLWDEVSKKVEQQQLLNDKIILEMTELKYQKKINKLFNWELTATIFNMIVAILIIIFFYKLDTIFLQISGIISILGFGSSFIPMRKIQDMKNIDVANNNYLETIAIYRKKKKEFFNIQKLSFFLAVPIMIFGLPVYLKIAYNTNLNFSPISWIYYIVFIIIFLLIIAKIVGKKYGGLTQSAEEILKELE